MAFRRTMLTLPSSFKRRVKYDIEGSVCQRCERFNPDPSLPMVVHWEGLSPDSPEPGKEDRERRVFEDSRSTWCKVVAKHAHGRNLGDVPPGYKFSDSEIEERTLDFGSTTWGWLDVAQRLKLVRWFDPAEVEDEGRLVVPVKVQLVRPR